MILAAALVLGIRFNKQQKAAKLAAEAAADEADERRAHSAGGIQGAHLIAELFQRLKEVFAVLGADLVADAPEDDRRMVAVAAQHDLDFLEALFVVDQIKVHAAVLPLIAVFVDDQQPQLVAQVIKLLRHRIVGAAHGVDAELFSAHKAAPPQLDGNSRTESASVVVEIDAPELHFDAVQDKAVLLVEHSAAYAKVYALMVDGSFSLEQRRFKAVQLGL